MSFLCKTPRFFFSTCPDRDNIVGLLDESSEQYKLATSAHKPSSESASVEEQSLEAFPDEKGSSIERTFFHYCKDKRQS